MISIIISSADPSKLRNISDNIAATIGIAYELIAIDNFAGEKGLCKVYNEGINRATNDLMCFVHEDVIFHTNGWGVVVVKAFSEDARLGLLGVAGSAYKSMSPSSWWHPDKTLKCEYIHILQGSKASNELDYYHNRPAVDVGIAEVVAIDGVWLCTTRSLAIRHPFDENRLTGFHGYDLDYSFAIGQSHKVAVTFDVVLEHHSKGHYSRDWVTEVLKVHRKWIKHLPNDFLGFDEKTLKKNEKVAFKWFIDQMFQLGFSASQVLRVLIQFPAIYRRFGYGLFFSLLIHCLKSRTKN